MSTFVYSNDHGDVPAGSGAFVALMVQAQDPDAYIAALKKKPCALQGHWFLYCRRVYHKNGA
tara:strand:+ start:362 stop:547 length:186 start_codon:yes stop_codon:yes gene_type:complete